MAVIVKISFMLLSIIALSEAAECPPLWSFFEGSCYRYFGPQKTWEEAEEHCQQYFASNGQGHLASIHQSSTHNFLVELWKTSVVSHDIGDAMWIGLTDENVDSQFTWSDGTAYDFEVWTPSQPNGGHVQGCVELWNLITIEWNDASCSDESSFVCQMSVGK